MLIRLANALHTDKGEIWLQQEDEFLRQVGKSGLSVKAFAELLFMNRVSISNLSKMGEVPVHLAVIAALMGEMADKGLDFRIVLTRIKIEPRTAKGFAAQGGIWRSR